MAFKLLNRARMSVTGTPGTGTLTLNGATAGFQDLATAGLSDGDTTSYVIEDGSPMGSVWEIGVGTYHTSGTFTRDTVSKSSAGGTTKATFTSAAILSATVRAEDLMAVAGSVGTTSPSVVQAAYFGVDGITTEAVASFTNGLTTGNLLVVIGNFPDNDGNYGFNFYQGDVQYNNHSRTAWKVGWGYKVITHLDANHAPAQFEVGVTDVLSPHIQGRGIALEIAGADIAALTSSNWANGTLNSSSSSVSAAAVAHSLDIVFYSGDDGSTVTITAPSTSHVNQTYAFAEWLQRSSAGTLSITGSVSGGGGNGALVLNIPGV